MNFSEALVEVLRITARPDKTLDGVAALNKAISFCTLQGEFQKDLVEATLAIDGTLYGDTVSLASYLRFRRFVFVKPTGTRYYLTPLSADKIFTPKDQMQPNVYYIAGTSMTYTLSALNTSLEVGYLTYAPVLDATVNKTHWMLDMMPYAIIDLACAYIFYKLGDDTAALRHEKSGMDFYHTLRRDLSIGE